MPQILIKNKALENKLYEIVAWWEANDPDQVREWKDMMCQLRKVSLASYSDAQGRQTVVNMKVPTVLFMSIQHCLPDFGKDSDDIALLTKILRDFNGAVAYKSKFGKTFLS